MDYLAKVCFPVALVLLAGVIPPGCSPVPYNEPEPDCRTDADCSADEPYCIDRECMVCKEDADCEGDGLRCLPAKLNYGEGEQTFVNLCAKCAGHGDCPEGERCREVPACEITTRECGSGEYTYCEPLNPEPDATGGDGGGDTKPANQSGR